MVPTDVGERLLQLLRAEDIEQLAEIAHILSEAEWEALATNAVTQGLGPLLYQRLKPCASALPPSAWMRLEESYWQTAAANTLRFDELGRALEALREHGIRVLVLKGAALAEIVYENVALRPMGDVDLLIRKADLSKAIAVLKALGYRPDLREAQPGFTSEYENELAFFSPSGLLPLELHWHIVDAAFYIQRIPEEELWSHVCPAQVADQPVEVFDPAAALVYLAAHWMLHHQGSGLRWLCDLDRLIRALGPQLDWPQVLTLARSWHLLLPLREALRRLGLCLSTPIPEQARVELSRLPASRAESRVFAYLTSPRRDVISRFCRELLMIQGTRRRLRYLLYSVLPSRQYMAERYAIAPGHAVWPFYFLRVSKGIWQLAQALVAAFLARLRAFGGEKHGVI